MRYSNEEFMEMAFQEAMLAMAQGEVPIGAVLVETGTQRVIAKSGNFVERSPDPTAHAEIMVLREGALQLRTERLLTCDLYVTLEPCPMCAHAISLARIRRLYFAAYDVKAGGVDHGPRIFHSSSCHHIPEIYGGLQAEKGAKLLQQFFKGKRE